MNLHDYLTQSISYEDYRKENQLFIHEKQGDAMHHYYELNEQRAERLDKRIKVDETTQEKIKQLQKKVTLLAITEGWCGDAAQILPVVQQLTQKSEALTLRIVYRDQNKELMQSYLTNGGESIPILIGVEEETGEELFRWGPRPRWGMELLKEMKAGSLSKEEFHLQLQKKYNQDKGASIFNELTDLLTQ